VSIQRVGAMATLFCRRGPVRDFDDAAASDVERYAALFRHLLAAGIYLAPSQFEAMFLSLAHGDDELDRTVSAVAEFFAA
jgi:glutamate-1-semialdehyde 2,1-aminomutase